MRTGRAVYIILGIIIIIIVTVEAAAINATREDDFRTAAATLPRRPRHYIAALHLYRGRRLAVRSYMRIRTRKLEHFTACVESQVNQSGENNTRSLELIVLRCIYIYIHIRGGDDDDGDDDDDDYRGGGYVRGSRLYNVYSGEASRKWNR